MTFSLYVVWGYLKSLVVLSKRGEKDLYILTFLSEEWGESERSNFEDFLHVNILPSFAFNLSFDTLLFTEKQEGEGGCHTTSYAGCCPM